VAYLALALGLVGFGAIWTGLALAADPARVPRGPRWLAALLLALAVAGLVGVVVLTVDRSSPP